MSRAPNSRAPMAQQQFRHQSFLRLRRWRRAQWDKGSIALLPEKPTSILGPDISISGQQLVLKTKGSLLIRGQIQGDVHGEAVTVDHGASVTGVITARTIQIQGSVKGALKGSTVILQEHSTVDANIVHQKLSIAEGAQFDGSARRARDISEVTPDLS